MRFLKGVGVGSAVILGHRLVFEFGLIAWVGFLLFALVVTWFCYECPWFNLLTLVAFGFDFGFWAFA